MLKLALSVFLISAALSGIPNYLTASSSSGEEITGFDTLVAGAERIVEAKILDKRTKLNADGTIETTYTLSTITPIKGENANIQEITIPGGEVAGQGLIIPGMPELQIGDRNILFLSAASPQNNWRMPVGLKSGALKVQADSPNTSTMKVLRANIHSDRVQIESYEGTINEIFTEVEKQR
jgi:hypothetical protein